MKNALDAKSSVTDWEAAVDQFNTVMEKRLYALATGQRAAMPIETNGNTAKAVLKILAQVPASNRTLRIKILKSFHVLARSPGFYAGILNIPLDPLRTCLLSSSVSTVDRALNVVLRLVSTDLLLPSGGCCGAPAAQITAAEGDVYSDELGRVRHRARRNLSIKSAARGSTRNAPKVGSTERPGAPLSRLPTSSTAARVQGMFASSEAQPALFGGDAKFAAKQEAALKVELFTDRCFDAIISIIARFGPRVVAANAHPSAYDVSEASAAHAAAAAATGAASAMSFHSAEAAARAAAAAGAHSDDNSQKNSASSLGPPVIPVYSSAPRMSQHEAIVVAKALCVLALALVARHSTSSPQLIERIVSKLDAFVPLSEDPAPATLADKTAAAALTKSIASARRVSGKTPYLRYGNVIRAIEPPKSSEVASRASIRMGPLVVEAPSAAGPFLVDLLLAMSIHGEREVRLAAAHTLRGLLLHSTAARAKELQLHIVRSGYLLWYLYFVVPHGTLPEHVAWPHDDACYSELLSVAVGGNDVARAVLKRALPEPLFVRAETAVAPYPLQQQDSHIFQMRDANAFNDRLWSHFNRGVLPLQKFDRVMAEMDRSHETPTLIWAEENKIELLDALQSEIEDLRVQRDVDPLSTWDHEGFDVAYPSLTRHLKVGQYYIHTLLPELTRQNDILYAKDPRSNLLVPTGAVPDPTWPLTIPDAELPVLVSLCFQRAVVEDDVGWKLACIRTMTALYIRYPDVLQDADMMPYLIWLLTPKAESKGAAAAGLSSSGSDLMRDQSSFGPAGAMGAAGSPVIWRDHVLTFLERLLTHVGNINRFVNADGVNVLVHYIVQMHRDGRRGRERLASLIPNAPYSVHMEDAGGLPSPRKSRGVDSIAEESEDLVSDVPTLSTVSNFAASSTPTFHRNQTIMMTIQAEDDKDAAAALAVHDSSARLSVHGLFANPAKGGESDEDDFCFTSDMTESDGDDVPPTPIAAPSSPNAAAAAEASNAVATAPVETAEGSDNDDEEKAETDTAGAVAAAPVAGSSLLPAPKRSPKTASKPSRAYSIPTPETMTTFTVSRRARARAEQPRDDLMRDIPVPAARGAVGLRCLDLLSLVVAKAPRLRRTIFKENLLVALVQLLVCESERVVDGSLRVLMSLLDANTHVVPEMASTGVFLFLLYAMRGARRVTPTMAEFVAKYARKQAPRYSSSRGGSVLAPFLPPPFARLLDSTAPRDAAHAIVLLDSAALEETAMLWTPLMRGDLANAVCRRVAPFAAQLASDPFVVYDYDVQANTTPVEYPTHTRELYVGDVYVRVFNEKSAAEMADPSAADKSVVVVDDDEKAAAKKKRLTPEETLSPTALSVVTGLPDACHFLISLVSELHDIGDVYAAAVAQLGPDGVAPATAPLSEAPNGRPSHPVSRRCEHLAHLMRAQVTMAQHLPLHPHVLNYRALTQLQNVLAAIRGPFTAQNDILRVGVRLWRAILTAPCPQAPAVIDSATPLLRTPPLLPTASTTTKACPSCSRRHLCRWAGTSFPRATPRAR